MGLIIQFGLLILLSSIFAVLLRFVKQPPIIAYLAVGVLVSFLNLDIIPSSIFFTSELAIILLLYLVGLDMKFLKKTPTIIGILQVLLTTTVFFFVTQAIYQFEVLTAIYIALALTFSSTILVGKALEERKEENTFHGKLLTDIMTVQDVIALLIIVIFTTMNLGISINENIYTLGIVFAKIIAVFLTLFVLAKYVLPKVFEKASESVELVFIVGLGWMFLGVLLAFVANFSTAVGAFLAGMSLASLPFAFEIKDRTVGLRDFSLILFLTTIGLQLTFVNLDYTKLIILAVAALLLGPLIISIITSFFGYDKKKIFIVSILPNQISEFSLILLVIGLQLGHITNNVLTIIISIAIITILLSSIASVKANRLFEKVKHIYALFEWKKKRTKNEWRSHVVILGMGELGLKAASQFKRTVVFIDNDPEKIKLAKLKKIKAIYGDASSEEVWNEVNLDKAKVLIDTTKDKQNKILKWLDKNNKHIITITENNNKKFDFVISKDEAKWELLKSKLKKWN